MKQKNRYINLVPIKQGGGLQNALNFINELDEGTDITVIANIDSEVCELATEKNIKTLKVKNNLFARLFFEIFVCREWCEKDSVVLTLFGPPPIGLVGYTSNICGFAYSNILYPDIEFWNYLPYHKRVKKKIIDKYRLIMAKKASTLVFETDLLRRRALKSGYFEEAKLVHIPMAPSNYISPSPAGPLTGRGFSLIYIGSAHPNKRLHLLVPLLAKLVQRFPKITLDFTLSGNENSYIKSIIKEFNALELSDNIRLLGPVNPKDIYKVLRGYNAMINISKLESFSNNFVESWVSGTPLIVTDSDWSRHSCLDAAVYINPTDVEESANIIGNLLTDKNTRNKIIENRYEAISQLVTIETKVNMYLNLMR